MRYNDLSAYAGAKTACDHCKKAFKVGRVIHVSTKHGLVFCESDSDGSTLCMQNYLFFRFCTTHPGQALSVGPQVFQRHLTLEEIGIVSQRPPSLWQRIKKGFGDYWSGR